MTDQEASSERCSLNDGDADCNADLYMFLIMKSLMVTLFNIPTVYKIRRSILILVLECGFCDVIYALAQELLA